jgi:hypothetical protein
MFTEDIFRRLLASGYCLIQLSDEKIVASK